MDDIAREAAAIADQVRRQFETDPFQQLRWDVEIGAGLWGTDKAEGGHYTDITQPLGPVDERRLAQRAARYALVDDRLAARGLTERQFSVETCSALPLVKVDICGK